MRAPFRLLTTLRLPFRPWLICMPFRLMERICPLGRRLAVPPPRSETCLPASGRLTPFDRAVTLPPAFPMGPRGLLMRMFPFPVLPTPIPFLPAVPTALLGRIPALVRFPVFEVGRVFDRACPPGRAAL